MKEANRTTAAQPRPWHSPAALCRMDDTATASLRGGAQPGRLIAPCFACLCVGSALFGCAFGLWRGPGQALLSAVKMPLLMLLVTAFTAAVSTQLAQVLGARLTLRQTLASMLLAFAIASLILGALAPVTAFFAWQAPPPGTPGDMAAYRALLLLNTAAVGVAGVLGNLKLYRLLATLLGSRALAARVLAAWIGVAGLTGFELSWVLSPFLSRPDLAVPLVNPIAFRVNVFEYLVRVGTGRPLPAMNGGDQ